MLNGQIGLHFGLVGVQIQIFDSDFEEWCTPTGVDDLQTEQTNQVRVFATGFAGK